MCGTSSHSTEPAAPSRAGRLRHGQQPLPALCLSFSLGLVLPGALSRSEGHGGQSTCHVVARFARQKVTKGTKLPHAAGREAQALGCPCAAQ